MNDNKIEKLWQWFSDNEQEIRDGIDSESTSERDYIVKQLNELILDLGAFYWEIGPGLDKAWYLTISPNGRKDLLTISKRIMASAPNLDQWEYNFSKPANDWDRQFKLHDEYMTEQLVNASDWSFVATQNENGMIEIILEADNITHLDADTAKSAADLVVLNEIGEAAKILNVVSIDIVQQLESHHTEQKTEIQYLTKQVEEFLSSSK